MKTKLLADNHAAIVRTHWGQGAAVFEASSLIPLINHAMTSPSHIPDPQGESAASNGLRFTDWSTNPPGLILRADQGVYFMSNGLAPLSHDNPHRRLYAFGMAPDEDEGRVLQSFMFGFSSRSFFPIPVIEKIVFGSQYIVVTEEGDNELRLRGASFNVEETIA